MATDAKIREHAELIVNTCFTVEQGDVVTIITDDEHAHLAKVVADVAAEKGAWPVIMNNETQVARGLADTLFPMAPPKNLRSSRNRVSASGRSCKRRARPATTARRRSADGPRGCAACSSSKSPSAGVRRHR